MAISKHQFHTISTFLGLLPSSWSSVLTFVLALAVSAVGGHLDAERQASEERNRVLGELALARARVEGVLKATFNSTDGLVHLISLQGGIQPDLFARMAHLAIGKNPHVRNITVAPDDQVSMVYPLAGNEKALGIRFANYPEQYRTVRQARERQMPILAGPVQLVQGGRALIQHSPVFTPPRHLRDTSRYWGTVSIVANIDQLLGVGSERQPDAVRLAIRGKDAQGERGALVDGEEEVFALAPLLMDIQVPGGKWQMAAVPRQGWQTRLFYSSPYFHLGLAISLLLTLLTGLRARHNHQLHERNTALEAEVAERQKVEEALREEEERFRTLFDQSPDPSSIIEGHLMVKANSAARRVFGQHPGENQGFHPAQLSPPYQPDGLLSQQKAEHMMTIAQARGSHRFEWIHLRGDGTPFFTEVTLIAVTMRGKPTIHAVVHDISERKQAEEALQTSRNLLQAIIESAGALIYVFDRDERLLMCNQQFERTFSRSRQQMIGQRRHAFMHTHTADEHEANDRKVMAARQRVSFEERTQENGQERIYLTVKCPIIDHSEIRGIVGISTDITERKQTEESLRLYANIFEQTTEAILVTDQNNRIVQVNPALEQITGYSFAELRGHTPSILASGKTPEVTYRALWTALTDTGHWQGELWDRRKDGVIYPKWTNISTIRDASGQPIYYLALFTDITERKHAEERIHHLAHHDKLTGLSNRHSLQERLGQVLASAQYADTRLAVMFIDLDRFKIINDTLGHHIGDQLLVEVAARLHRSVHASDIVARLGGDEFVVVLTSDTAAHDALPIGCQILSTLACPYDIEGNILHSTPSIGISLYPEDGDSVEALMKTADTAMYHAKAQGRNNIQFFTADMNAAAAERMELERDLHHALAEQQLQVHYQLQVHANSGQACGVEALVRWPHPTRGMVPPLKFIPIAEESGLIEPLGAWVLEQACQQVAHWQAQGIYGVRMAVNLSAHQLRSASLVDTVSQAIRRHGIQAGDLELEITESVVMKDPEAAIQKLQALRNLGVSLAIDDFGTGYSSLAYLKLMPVDLLKIDRSFVKDIETDKNDAAICASILALAHSLGLKVVAEGVETAAQRDFLHAHHCDYLQGYLFAKPEPGEQCLARLSRMQPAAQA